tara:strand:+ start:2132 stop:3985 length:1854 start_codon:yes stop_codon:yes gene_type:complete
MCGILGEFSFDSTLIDKDIFLSLLSKSNRRGPDHTGYYSDELIQFGFNRLSILDLSANGNQPIHSISKRYTMIFNGEIYNHKELRSSLPLNKYSFKGNGDTESLIACFDNYGIIATIKMLDGMFSIGIFDNFNKSLYLIRDFAGIKPLHYGISNGRVFFASQYDQIIDHPCYTGSLKPDILKLYLEQHFIPAPYGILENTFQVEPGEIICFDHLGNKYIEKYWELPSMIYNKIDSDKIAIDETENALSNAIKDELVSDVPIGAFLSGGIDSSLICKYASQILNSNLNTFTIGTDSKKHDESKLATEYAKQISSNHYLEFINSNKATVILDNAMNSLTEPFADFSIIPTYQVCNNAKKNAKVILSGDGGDELFFGYDRSWSIINNRFLQKYPFPIKYFFYGLDKLITQNSIINSGVLWDSLSDSYRFSQSKISKNWMRKIAPELDNIDSPNVWGALPFPHTYSKRKLANYIRKAEFYHMMQKTLFKLDRASMANSLEVRVPFLKKTMIEAALNIDPWLNIKGRMRKRILYKLNEKKYSNDITSKLKKGFSIPLSKWIREELRESVGDIILSRSHISEFNLNYSMINTMFSEHLSKRADYHFPLFTIYSLFKWNEKRKK